MQYRALMEDARYFEESSQDLFLDNPKCRFRVYLHEQKTAMKTVVSELSLDRGG